MSDAVLRSTQGRIGILTVNNPPVNALAAAVRDGIKEGVEAFGAGVRSVDLGTRRLARCACYVLRTDGGPRRKRGTNMADRGDRVDLATDFFRVRRNGSPGLTLSEPDDDQPRRRR